jgi:transcriptional regulator with XRE-family HTH domain
MPDLDFAKRLAKAMGEARLTQAELAERLGVTQPTVSRWLSGSAPQMRVSAALCHALDVPHEWLIFGTEKEPPLVFTDAMRRRLVEARKRNGKTLEDVARNSGYGVKDFAALEKGSARPDRRMLAIWLHNLNVNEKWLVAGTGEIFRREPSYYYIPPWEMEKARQRAKALREQAQFLIRQAERLEWEMAQSKREFKETDRADPRIIRAARKRQPRNKTS